jgi:uroporphyrinogen decarboxylase
MALSKATFLWPGHEPDFNRLLKVFCRDGIPDRVPFIELFADPEVVGEVLREKPIPFDQTNREQQEAKLLQQIRFCYTLGWDFVWVFACVPFPRDVLRADDTAQLAHEERAWVDENRGTVETMEDFERYPWPTLDMANFADLEFVGKNLPDGMKIVATTSGILEWVMWLMGFAPFAMALYEQPDLVEAMFQKIGDIYAEIYRVAAGMPNVGATFLGDDMGYKTGTFIRPDMLRHYVFPRQKRLADITHSYGIPFLLHACGNLEAIMDDLIDYVGIDGKHSFEDVFLTVGEAKRRYGDRISILGGVDVGMLARATEEEVRAYTRRTLEECMPGGGYALGTGNSVANYIPVRNYIAMLDEGMKVGWYC